MPPQVPPRKEGTPRTQGSREPRAARVVQVRTEDNVFQHLEVLKRNRTKRHRFRECFVEGVKAITRALEHGWTVNALAYAADRRLSGWAQGVLAAAPDATRILLAPHLMEKVSDREEPSELIAILAIPEDDPGRIAPKGVPLVVVFDRPTSPGNLGTIIRSCDALGADGLVITGHGVDLYDPQTVRASVGSLFSLPVVRLGGPEEVATWARQLGARTGTPVQVVGASGEAERAAEEVDLSGPTVLVVGNETAGLSAAYRERCDTLARIPMYGAADSLNVAAAASILLYEAGRQRRSARH